MDRRIKNFVELQLEKSRDSRLIEARRKYLISQAKGSEDPVATAALMIVNDAYLCNADLTSWAIKSVLDALDPIDQRLIDLLYFKRSHTVTGAGLEVGLSKTQAYQHRNAIITQIARKLGYIE